MNEALTAVSPEQLRALLDRRAARATSPLTTALDQLKRLPFDDLGFARIDNHRALRTGAPEVIYCAGKTPEQVVAHRRAHDGAWACRCWARAATPRHRAAVQAALPGARSYHAIARAFVDPARRRDPGAHGRTGRAAGQIVVVCTGGTSDMPVAEEAALTAEMMGNRVLRLYDVGVAGLHRLLRHTAALQEASVVIVVAGMEGALASVVGRPGRRAGDRRADQHRLRRQLRRPGRAAGDAQ